MVSPLVPFCDTLYPQAWEFQVEKCSTSIDRRMQKRHTPRILESMNDMDLLSDYFFLVGHCKIIIIVITIILMVTIITIYIMLYRNFRFVGYVFCYV